MPERILADLDAPTLAEMTEPKAQPPHRLRQCLRRLLLLCVVVIAGIVFWTLRDKGPALMSCLAADTASAVPARSSLS